MNAFTRFATNRDAGCCCERRPVSAAGRRRRKESRYSGVDGIGGVRSILARVENDLTLAVFRRHDAQPKSVFAISGQFAEFILEIGGGRQSVQRAKVSLRVQ